MVELAGKRVGVAHGHMTTDVRQVLAERPDLLLTGHSHFPKESVMGSVRRINPGALSRANEYTVALLDLETGTLRWLPVAR